METEKLAEALAASHNPYGSWSGFYEYEREQWRRVARSAVAILVPPNVGGTLGSASNTDPSPK